MALQALKPTLYEVKMADLLTIVVCIYVACWAVATWKTLS